MAYFFIPLLLLIAHWQKYTLQFRFDAGTSRGVLKTKDTWYLTIWNGNDPYTQGIGECGPLKALSPDDRPDFEKKLEAVCQYLAKHSVVQLSIPALMNQLGLKEFPSILFGLETALADLAHDGKRIILPSSFSDGTSSLPINGLVWMGDETFMRKQLEEKITQGYSCIKIKIGAIDFEQELKLIKRIRAAFPATEMTIRLDANGAFTFKEALEKIERLIAYDIHSIEQPIKAGQLALMKKLCQESAIPVALDEELIGIKTWEEKKDLLETIQPPYIILKPTLVGGLYMTEEWITLAEEKGISWWITSALESNIGLNAIAQFTATKQPSIPQGLGTGQLYHNNIDSPLTIKQGRLHYLQENPWDSTFFA